MLLANGVPIPLVTGRKVTILPADVAAQPMWSAALQQQVRLSQNRSAAAKYVVDYLLPSVNVNVRL